MSRTMKSLNNTFGKMMIEHSVIYHAFCPIGKAPYHGKVVLSYVPLSKLLEFISYDEMVSRISREPLSIEAFCSHIFEAVDRMLYPIDLTITVYAETESHGPVKVSKTKEA